MSEDARIEAAAKAMFIAEAVQRGISLNQATSDQHYFWEHQNDSPEYQTPIRNEVNRFRGMVRAALAAADAAPGHTVVSTDDLRWVLDYAEERLLGIDEFDRLRAKVDQP